MLQPTPFETARTPDEDDPRSEFVALVKVLTHRIPISRRWTQSQLDSFVQALRSNLITLMDVEDEKGTSSMNGIHYERMPAGNGDMRS